MFFMCYFLIVGPWTLELHILTWKSVSSSKAAYVDQWKRLESKNMVHQSFEKSDHGVISHDPMDVHKNRDNQYKYC